MDELFKSRREVELLMLIIQEWQEEYPQDVKSDFAEEIFNKLDYIHMVRRHHRKRGLFLGHHKASYSQFFHVQLAGCHE